MIVAEDLPVDSAVLGLPVFQISGIDSHQELKGEVNRIDDLHQENFLICKISSDRLDLIHFAEELGFRFVEIQLDTALSLRKAPRKYYSNYEYSRIEDQVQLEQVLEIASTTNDSDRYSRDPMFGHKLSGRRYREFLLKSFDDPMEEIWAVVNKRNRAVLTFRSHRHLSDRCVRLLNGGVHPAYKGLGLGVVSSHLCFLNLISRGYETAETSISASNTPIVNLELGHCGFRVTGSVAVLRRLQKLDLLKLLD